MTIVDFENVEPHDYGMISNGYEGLKWRNFEYKAPGGLTAGSGYEHVLNSGKQVAFNGSGDPAVIAAHQDFTLESGYFASAWSTGLRLRVTAFDNGVKVGVKFVVLDQAKTLVTFGPEFGSIDKVHITSTGGVDADGSDHGEGTNFAVDDLAFHFDADATADTAATTHHTTMAHTGVHAHAGVEAHQVDGFDYLTV